MTDQSGTVMFHVGKNGELTEQAVTSAHRWSELEELSQQVPPETWPALRTLGWLVLKHLVPALTAWLVPLALLRLMRFLLNLDSRLADRWHEYVREDPTIRGALNE